MQKVSLIFTLCLFWAAITLAQSDTLRAPVLEEIVLTGSRSLQAMPLSVATDTLRSLETYQQGLRNAFLRQPGVLAVNGENFAQDVRISVRGFGSRSAFGIRGIRVWMDGIPLTSPDGTTQLDEISMWDVQAISYVRSGMSARFGNAGGGGIMLVGPAVSNAMLFRSSISSYGAYNAGARVGYGNMNARHVTSVNHHFFKGKRQFAASQNTTLYHKTKLWLSPDWQLTILGGAYHSPVGEDPGALTLAEFTANPYQANSRNVLFKAGEAVSGGMVAAQSQLFLSRNISWVSSVFLRKRLFEARLPFNAGGWVNLNRDFGGWHNTFEYISAGQWNISGGTAFDWQKDRRTLSHNNEGVKGVGSADQYERLQNAGAWMQIEWKKGIWRIQQLARYDLTRFRLEDLFLADGDQQGERIFHNRSIAWAASVALSGKVQCSASLTSGFESPTLNELTNNPTGTGGFNPDLQPEKSWQGEVRIHSTQETKVQWSAAVFYTSLKDLIIGYELPATPGRTYYRNAPRASRKGIEVWAKSRLSASLNIEANYTFSHFQYTQWEVGSASYTGNFQPLIPMHRAGLRATASLGKYMDASCQIQAQTSMFAEDANAVEVGGFFECNAELSTSPRLFRNTRIGMTGSNLFGTSPYSNIRANASASRYYEAATPNMVSVFVEWSPMSNK